MVRARRVLRAALAELYGRGVHEESFVARIALRIRRLPTELDDAILVLVESESTRDLIAAFVWSAWRTPSDVKPSLREHLEVALALFSSSATLASRALVARRAARCPGYVEGAKHITRMMTTRQCIYSKYALVLAADGSPDSIAILNELFENAGEERDALLDRVRREFLPILRSAKTDEASALSQHLLDSFVDRVATSPARSFASRIGLPDPDAELRFTWLVGTEDGHQYRIALDSTRARWFVCTSSRAGWSCTDPLSIALPSDVTKSSLRIFSGTISRSRLHEWACSMLVPKLRAIHRTRIDRRVRGRRD